jgi:hypothetical protein
MERQTVTPDKLSDVMEFDHVIRVHADGTVSDGPDGLYFELYDDELSAPDGWELMNGYSGQYGYSGPVMHNSEFIGGGMARDILAAPGLYVALVSYYSPEPDDDDGEPMLEEGWAIARLLDDDGEVL